MGDEGWFRAHFSETRKGDVVGWAADAAAAWLQRECKRAGLWDNRTPVRGTGTWRAGRAATTDVLIHTGDTVLIGSRRHDAGLFYEGAIYPAKPAIGRPAEKPASAAECRGLEGALANWVWDDPVAGPVLFLGFVGQALLGAATDWRSHIYIQAPWGSGKTWLSQVMQGALGPMA